MGTDQSAGFSNVTRQYSLTNIVMFLVGVNNTVSVRKAQPPKYTDVVVHVFQIFKQDGAATELNQADVKILFRVLELLSATVSELQALGVPSMGQVRQVAVGNAPTHQSDSGTLGTG